MNGLICQKCGSTRQDPHYEKDNFFVCSDCGHVIGYDCPECEHFYEDNRLIPHNDLYVCKVCGHPQYGYAEWKNKKRGETC